VMWRLGGRTARNAEPVDPAIRTTHLCHSIVECELLVGTWSAEGIMASGHVSRIKRPNTWLHRPMLQNVKKALANSEPSTHGTKRTLPDVRLESVKRSEAGIGRAGFCTLGLMPCGLSQPQTATLAWWRSRQRRPARCSRDHEHVAPRTNAQFLAVPH